MSMFPLDKTVFQLEERQYQDAVFRIMMRWVLLVCLPLGIVYLFNATQENLIANLILAVCFTANTTCSIYVLQNLTLDNIDTLSNLFLGLATATLFFFGFFQPIEFVFISAHAAAMLIALAAFLKSQRWATLWSTLNITGFAVVLLARRGFDISLIDLGILHDMMMYSLPIVILIVLSEMSRVTTQHFKMNLQASHQRQKDVIQQTAKLRELAEELARSNRELEDFAYIASHDLQEPLRKINTFGERLQTKFSDDLDEQALDYLRRMRNAASRMQTLIQDLLGYSRITTKQEPHQPIDLKEIINNIASDLEVLIHENNAVLDVGTFPTIMAAPGQMRQLMQNLIVNSLKYRSPDRQPVLHIHGERINEPSPACRITVSDNGIGFEQQYAERIFGVFQRLHGRNQYQGSGIGLATCRKIVEQYHGTIEANGIQGKGATFIITIPYTDDIMELLHE